jgi:hypothetical protein
MERVLEPFQKPGVADSLLVVLLLLSLQLLHVVILASSGVLGVGGLKVLFGLDEPFCSFPVRLRTSSFG